MVDVIRQTNAIGQADHIGHRSHHVVGNDVLGHETGEVGMQIFAQCIFRGFLDHLTEHREIDHLVDADIFRREGEIQGSVDKIVADNTAHHIVHLDIHAVDALVLDRPCILGGNGAAFFDENLAGGRIDDAFCSDMTLNAAGQGKLLVELVTAYAHQIIALVVIEIRIKQLGSALHGGGLTGLLLLIDLNETFVLVLRIVALFEGGIEALVIAEQAADLFISAVTDCTEKHCDRELAVAVNTDPQNIIAVGLVLNPGTAVRDDLRRVKLFAGLVTGHGVVHTGGTDKLGDNNTFCTVDDERAVLGHQREIAHEYVGFFDFSGFMVGQANKNFQGRGIRHVAFTAARNCIFGLV